MIIEFKLSHNSVEAIKNISCLEGERAVDLLLYSYYTIVAVEEYKYKWYFL